MSDHADLAQNILRTWSGHDLEACGALLRPYAEMDEKTRGDRPEFAVVAAVIKDFAPTFDTVPQGQLAAAQLCLQWQAEILRLAALDDPDFVIAAIRALSARHRDKDAMELLPIAQMHPDFGQIAPESCISLFQAGRPEDGLALLRDRFKMPGCSMHYVNELVKIARFTDHGDSELARLEAAIDGGVALVPWEIAYYCTLGIGMMKPGIIAAGLETIARSGAAATSIQLGRAALHLDTLQLHDAWQCLQSTSDDQATPEWRHDLYQTLQELVSVQMKADQWQEKHRTALADRPKVALTLSGFVRSYDGLDSMFDFLLRHVERWDIEIFAQTFDRLGNLHMRLEGLDHTFYDYNHGGFFREIMKTPPLRIDHIYRLLAPIALQVEPRHPDAHYIHYLGMAHPQWLAVWEAWQLFERHRAKSGEAYRLAIRGRYDKSYDKLDLDRLGTLRDDQLATPADENYGYGRYKLCDQLAVGSPEAVRAYCSIGDGRNFLSIEETDVWKNELNVPKSHECHLALWLEMHKVDNLKPAWLRLTP